MPQFDATASINLAISLCLQYLPQAFLALLTLWVGFRLTAVAERITSKALQLRHVDRSLAGFLESMVSIGLKALIIITVATMVGVQTTSFIALLGAVGLAVGLSLQGSLSNLAGGVLIILFKPFSVGDVIQAQGHTGTVHTIELFTTILKTDAEKGAVIIPNGPLSNAVIVNHSRKL